MKETSYNKKGTFNISMLGVAVKIFGSPNSTIAELGDFSYYIKTINSNNINRKIRMINERIKNYQ